MPNTTKIHTKVLSEDKTKEYRITTEWENDNFQISVLEKDAAWYALAAKDYIKQLADQHELEFNEYLRNVQKFMRNTESSSITFNIVNSQFIIYHNIEMEKLRVKYFFIKLKKADYRETAEAFIDSLILQHTHTVSKLEDLMVQKMESESKKMLWERKCNEFVELKHQSDLEMYSAFTLLLNEKKKRIQFLTELLDSDYGKKMRKIVKKTKLLEENNDPQPSTSKTKEVLSDSEVESEPDSSSIAYNTDDETKNFLPAFVKETQDGYLFRSESPDPVLPKRVRMDESIVNFGPSMIKEEKLPTEKVTNEPTVVASQSKMNNSYETFNTQEFLDKL